MIYLVANCVEIVHGEVKALCGGYCCGALNFSWFPHSKWVEGLCSYLKFGVCSCYHTRPMSCRGAPFYDYPDFELPLIFGPNRFQTPWCHYRLPIMQYYNLPYEICGSGTECIERYTREGLGDFQRWTLKWFKGQTVFWE